MHSWNLILYLLLLLLLLLLILILILHFILDRLSTLVDDDWWDVHAQMIVVCSSLLDQINLQSNPDECEKVYVIVSNILLKQHNHCILRIGWQIRAEKLSKINITPSHSEITYVHTFYLIK